MEPDNQKTSTPTDWLSVFSIIVYCLGPPDFSGESQRSAVAVIVVWLAKAVSYCFPHIPVFQVVESITGIKPAFSQHSQTVKMKCDHTGNDQGPHLSCPLFCSAPFCSSLRRFRVRMRQNSIDVSAVSFLLSFPIV